MPGCSRSTPDGDKTSILTGAVDNCLVVQELSPDLFTKPAGGATKRDLDRTLVACMSACQPAATLRSRAPRRSIKRRLSHAASPVRVAFSADSWSFSALAQ
ncbi:hypothetical protein EON64_06955 [archaeon]|nr:MAG: hypothetical protein EON64_06955 [archaeon]